MTESAAKKAGRPRINADVMPVRFREGTFDRIGNVLKTSENETRTDFIRDAVKREIERREGGGHAEPAPISRETYDALVAKLDAIMSTIERKR